MQNTKYLLFGVIFILSGCSAFDVPKDYGTHYWEKIDHLMVKYVSDEDFELMAERRGVPKSKAGMAVWAEANGKKYCSITIRQRFRSDRELYRHEVKHCHFGHYHAHDDITKTQLMLK